MIFVPLPAAPYWTAGCINIKSLGWCEVHKVVEPSQAQLLSARVEITVWGVAAKAETVCASVLQPLKALHSAPQPLNSADSDTPNTQKVSGLVSERYRLDVRWAAMWHTKCSPPVQYKKALCFSYHYRITGSIPKEAQHKNWSGSEVFKVCPHRSPNEQVEAGWHRAVLGHTQGTQAVLGMIGDSCTHHFTVSLWLYIL